MKVSNEYCDKCGKTRLFQNSKCVGCKEREKKREEIIWENSLLEDKIQILSQKIKELELRIAAITATY
jgi:hypothetical protein